MKYIILLIIIMFIMGCTNFPDNKQATIIVTTMDNARDTITITYFDNLKIIKNTDNVPILIDNNNATKALYVQHYSIISAIRDLNVNTK